MREIREVIFRGKRTDNGKWIYGDLRHISDGHGGYILCIVDNTNGRNNDVTGVEVLPETVGQYTGLTDKNGVKIFEGDIVKIVDFQIGCVVYECGAFGIVVKPYVDWNYLASEIAEITGCNNMPYFCFEDNFISLWELMCNYNQEENSCNVVQVIGNIHDNPDILKGGGDNG